MVSSAGLSLQLLICASVLFKTEAFFAEITYLNKAVVNGAVCLDKSPPAYYFDKGIGVGDIDFEGGGWCNNVT